jgi:hypothetical protein
MANWEACGRSSYRLGRLSHIANCSGNFQPKPRMKFVFSEHATECNKLWPTSLEVYKFGNWPDYKSGSYRIVTRTHVSL